MARTGNVYITISGKDNVSKTLKQVNKGLGSLSTKSLAVGTAIGTALGGIALQGINALAGGIKDAFGNAATYQKLGNQLAQTIETTGNAANITVDGVKALSGSLESLSGVDENLIIQNANLLASFKGIENEGGKAGGTFDRTMAAALDLSTTMGNDLTGATKVLGKALSNPIKGLGALSKAGVTFTEQETERIKALQESGKLHEAQAIVLKKVEGSFKGAAEAAGKGFDGALARAQDAVEDLIRDAVEPLLDPLAGIADTIATDVVPNVKKFFVTVSRDKDVRAFINILEEAFAMLQKVVAFIIDEVIPKVVDFGKKLGSALFPKLKQVADFIRTEVVPAIQKFFGFISENRGVLIFLAGAIAGVMTALKAYNLVMAAYRIATTVATAAQLLFNLALTLNPIGLVVLAIAALIGGLTALYFANEDVRKVLDGVFKIMGDVAGVIFGALGDAVEFITGLFGGVLSVVGSIVDAIKTLLGLIGDVARAIANSPIGQIAGAIGGFVGDLFGGERAKGGPVAAGKAYLVGEKGPELFVPGQSGSIVPNTGLAMPAMSAGGAGGVAGEIRRAFAGLGIYLDGESVGRVSDRRLSVALATTGTTSRSASAFRYGR